MVARFLLICFFLAAATAAQDELQWTAGKVQNLSKCVGMEARFPWNYSLPDGGHLVDLQWYFQPEGAVEEKPKIIAIQSAGTFIPNVHEPFAPHSMTFIENAGLKIDNVALNNSGRYYVKADVRVHETATSYISTGVFLEVHDGPALVSGEDRLKVSYEVNTSSDANKNDSEVILKCGQFQTRGHPPASVTPSKDTLNSTSFEDGYFILSLDSSAKAGNYTCSLDSHSSHNTCQTKTDIKQGWAMVDEDHTELSVMRSHFETFQSQVNQQLQALLRRVEDLEQRVKGLDTMHRLTTQRDMSLRIDMQDFEGHSAYVVYRKFLVRGPSYSYSAHFGHASGPAGNSIGTDDYEFTTYDKDNDLKANGNCAEEYGGGGFWYSVCGYAGLNGRYGGYRYEGIFWYSWKNDFSAIRSVEMKIRPVH
ncbi:hypothetical protein BaRGS_00040234 [Batillaria attramentaria]|uniref:Fibrinogen C-terminal domain-containing protein n=1 Tax=Batillaria attramentaria TaxID=370345 RepID=A0ABD0J0T9_9CAEN